MNRKIMIAIAIALAASTAHAEDYQCDNSGNCYGTGMNNYMETYQVQRQGNRTTVQGTGMNNFNERYESERSVSGTTIRDLLALSSRGSTGPINTVDITATCTDNAGVLYCMCS